MIRRILFYAVTSALAATALVAGFPAIRGRFDPPGIAVAPNPNYVGVLTLGEKRTVGFVFRNRTAKPIRIVGAQLTCGPGGCNEITDLPLEIAPQSQATLNVVFTAQEKGDFVKDFDVFTDYFEMPTMELSIVGTIRAGQQAKPGGPTDEAGGTE